jgi:hypothetical protein
MTIKTKRGKSENLRELSSVHCQDHCGGRNET